MRSSRQPRKELPKKKKEREEDLEEEEEEVYLVGPILARRRAFRERTSKFLGKEERPDGRLVHTHANKLLVSGSC